MRRALLIAALLVLVAPAPAHAGALIDRAVEGLQSDNVYVDPDADPTLTAAQADALRDRIVSERADPMYVVVAPRAIVARSRRLRPPLRCARSATRSGPARVPT